MLSARKVELLAGLKVKGLELRNRELDFYMIRFSMTAGLSSIMTCLAYVGIIKIKIPHEMKEEATDHFVWQVAMFYICACAAMAFSLYNLVLTSFAMVMGQGLALRGPPGSIARAVRIFQDQWRVARIVLVSSLLCLVLAGTSISWMKLDKEVECAAGPVACWLYRYWRPVAVSLMVLVLMLAMFYKVRQMQLQLRIPTEHLVRGDLLVQNEEETRLDMLAEDNERIVAR